MSATPETILKTLMVNLKSNFAQGIDATTPQWQEIATKVPSSGSANYYGWLKDLPGIKEWVGERQLISLNSHGYAIENKTWESSISISRDDVEDDQIGQYDIIAKNYGEQVALFPDSLCYPLLTAGFNTLCFDGQNYFDTDHPLETSPSTTYSNVVGDPDIDLDEPWFLIDDTKVLKPIVFQERRPFDFRAMNDSDEYTWFNNQFAAGVDGRCNVGFSFPQIAIGSKGPLNESTYSEAKQRLRSMKKADGTPLNIRATKLVVGPNNESAAKKLINRQLADNGATSIYYNDVSIVSSPYID